MIYFSVNSYYIDTEELDILTCISLDNFVKVLTDSISSLWTSLPLLLKLTTPILFSIDFLLRTCVKINIQ